MQEIVTIGASHRANHLVTQFFNCQEQNLYVKDSTNSLDPSFFLHPNVDELTKTVSYYPRALLWEARNGFGSLGTYQYIPGSTDYYYQEDNESLQAISKDYQLIKTQEPVPRSKYQLALDENQTSLPKLDKESTKFWSDYSKLIYEPWSFNHLSEWYHDLMNPNRPDYQGLGKRFFQSMDQGSAEWSKQKDYFLDENLRKALEQCDSLQGFNVVTDIDSGWGGFTASMLESIRDELPKKAIFTWGFNEPEYFTQLSRQKGQALLNKIECTLKLSQESDLVFPLAVESEDMTNWEVASQLCKVYDTVASIMAIRDQSKRRSMGFLIDCLTRDNESRNIVSLMHDSHDNFEFGYFARSPRHYKKRATQNSKDPVAYYEFSQCEIVRGLKEDGSVERIPPLSGPQILQTTSYMPSDTICDRFVETTDFTIKLAMTEKSKDVLKTWNDYVTTYLRYDDKRESLREDIGTLLSCYQYGWDSEIDDDDSYDDGL